jgi:hypothetical protein
MSNHPDDSLNRDKIYQAFPLAGKQIRLLTIHPGGEDDPLKCALSLVDWNRAPPYEALSYAWGSTAGRQKMRLNDRIILVTQNLRNAVLSLRYLNRPRILWVDALCINQNSTLEKNHQIKLMDLIYSQSRLVKIWLGQEVEAIDRDDEPPFLRDQTGQGSSGPPAFIEAKRRRGTKEAFRHLRIATATAEEDDPVHRIGYKYPSMEDLSRGIAKCLPRPFVFSLDHDVTKEVDRLMNILNGHGQCVANDTWVRDGANDDNAAIMFGFLHMMARDAHPADILWLQDFCYLRNILKVLSAMLRRTWWDRTWTVQEIGLAPTADVVFGSLVVPWDILTAAAANIIKHRSSCCVTTFSEMEVCEIDVLEEFCRKVLDIEGIRRLCHGEGLLSKLDTTTHPNPATQPIQPTLRLLWYTRPRRAWDARDKIFGLLGVIKAWGDMPPVEPDYAAAIHTVFRQLTLTLIARTKGYDILIGNLGSHAYPKLPKWLINATNFPDIPLLSNPSLDQHPNEHPELVQLKSLATYKPVYINDLPSWVPDFAAPAANFERERVERSSLFCASSASIAPEPKLLNDFALEVHTLPVDSIKSVGPVMLVARATSLNPTLKQWLYLVLKDAVERGYDMSSFWDRDYLNGGNILCAWQRTICMDSIPTVAHTIPGKSTQYRRSEDADGVIYARWASSLLHAKDDGGHFELGPPEEKPGAADEEVALFGAAVKSATFLRRFFITEQGYFGLGPSSTCPGDEVKVFLGGRVPFVIRPAAPKNGLLPLPCTGSVYTLVGDCFLQGIMDGERAVKASFSSEESRQCILI